MPSMEVWAKPCAEPLEASADGGRWQSQGVSEEALDSLIASLIESDLARDKMAGRHYESMLEQFGRNAYYRSRIAADIYKNYPELCCPTTARS